MHFSYLSPVFLIMCPKFLSFLVATEFHNVLPPTRYNIRISEIFCIVCFVTRKKKQPDSTSAPPDDRQIYYNVPPTTGDNVNAAAQDNYVPLSAVANDNHTYSHLSTAAGQ